MALGRSGTRVVRELIVILAMVVVPSIAILSIKQVATVEPVVAALLSAVALAAPAVLAVLFSSREEVSGIRALTRPFYLLAAHVSRAWWSTVLFAVASGTAAFIVWFVGGGSLRSYPFACVGPVSIRYEVFGQPRIRTCQGAEILPVWRPFLNVVPSVRLDIERTMKCTGGGKTVAPYGPTASRDEWTCPNNRCPADMIYIPGGFRSFVGIVRPFCLDATEVTTGDYLACESCPRGEQGMTSDWKGEKSRVDRLVRSDECNAYRRVRSNHPMNCVDAAAARSFCVSRGRRLPTGAEFYWAASGADLDGAPSKYPWGNTPPGEDQVCWRPEDGSCPVGSFPKGSSPHGALDLSGNVWEWTGNWDGKAYLVMGGGWGPIDLPKFLEISPPSGMVAHSQEPWVRSVNLGFRCATSPTTIP